MVWIQPRNFKNKVKTGPEGPVFDGGYLTHLPSNFV